MSNILITGGTGSLGSALVKHFTSEGHRVTVLSRDIHKQAAMRRQYPNSKLIKYMLADICDREALLHACTGQNTVIHTAALKRIELGELYPVEYIRVNILGTQNVANACVDRGISSCLFISTDKATAANNLYGKTKAVAEHIWLSNATFHPTRFSALRYGNVVGSEGSVWHLWNNAKTQDKPLIVRYPNPTRFILSMNEAVKLVIDALKQTYSWQHKLFIPANLPAFSLHELASLIEPEQTNWQHTFLTPGEKLHEELLAENEYAKAVSGSNLLWEMCSIYDMDKKDRLQFKSDTARRISAEEVAGRMLNGN